MASLFKKYTLFQIENMLGCSANNIYFISPHSNYMRDLIIFIPIVIFIPI
jgi:hypothetical protein